MVTTATRLQPNVGMLPPDGVVFGSSLAMREVRTKLEMAANAYVPVLIQGESGTGKEIIAKMIHQGSPWRHGPFVKVNCPAIPGTLVETELFGYEKGAFTGADGSKPGRVELAHRGSLFLDEIAEMDIGLQAKLLQLLQDGQFCRIGSTEESKVEVRIVCATNRNLEEEIAQERFRQDLFYRINVVNITAPPLRERLQDIPALVEYFIATCNMTYNRKARPLSAQCMQILQRYDWPGNVRELENLIKRYVILGSEDAITGELTRIPKDQVTFSMPLDGQVSLKKMTKLAVRKLERNIIIQVLQANHWNRKKAARALSISYRALLYKMRDAGLPSTRRAK